METILVDEIESRVQLEHQPLLLNYTQGMEEAFFEERKRLGHQDGKIKIHSNLTVAISLENTIG